MNIYDKVSRSVSLIDYLTKNTDAKLIKSGDEYKSICPLHDEKEPSFYVSPAKNVWKCFGCDRGGGVIQFVSLYKSIPIKEAVKLLARQYSIAASSKDLEEFKRQEERRAKTQRKASIAQTVLEKTPEVCDYLKKRGFTEKTIKTFGVGYNKKANAITIPIHDPYGRVCGGAFRKLEGEPRYLNSSNNPLFNKSLMLFNLHRALPYAKKKIFVVEGYLDAMALYQSGVKNAVALGTSRIGKKQAQLLHRFLSGARVVIVPDTDTEGIRAAERNVKLLEEMGFCISVVCLPKKDAAQVLEEDGEEALKLAVENSEENAYLFLTKRIISTHEQKEIQYARVRDFLREVSVVNNLVVDDIINNYLAKKWGKDASLIKEYILGSGNEELPEVKIRTLASMIDDYQRMVEEGEALFNIKLGYPSIDKIFEGIYPSRSDIMTLLAYTGSGKTALSLNILYNIAKRYPDTNVIFFSLEMGYEEVLERLAQIVCGVGRGEVESAFLEKNSLFEDICIEISDTFQNTRIIDAPSLSVREIGAITKDYSLKEADEPVKLIFIDHLDYINVPGLSGNERVDQLMREVKEVSRSQRLAVFLIHQISRQSVKDPGSPVPADAGKWSGNVEATSSFVLTMYRPAFGKDISPEERERMQQWMGLEIRKSRRAKLTTSPVECIMDERTLRIREEPWPVRKSSAKSYVRGIG